MSQQLDAHGEAREALGTAVSSYGQRVLSDPHTLGNFVADLLPDLPRERSLLVAGAEADVAAEMRQHVQDQRIDPDTAVQLVARSLSERRAIDPAAGLWVATEYAQALGYQVRPLAPAVPSVPASAPSRPPAQFWQPPQPPPSWPSAGAPPQSWPPAASPAGRPASSRPGRKRGLIAAATAVVLIGGYLIAATFAHTFPFAKARPVAAASGVHSARSAPKPTASATPSPTATGPTLAAGVAPLTQLLPGGIDDPATQCKPDTPPWPWTMTGLVQALNCVDPGLPKGSVLAYQLDSRADYDATWQSFNKSLGITATNAGAACPPPTGGVGTAPMHSVYFPYQSGQVIECLMLKTDKGVQPVYTWSLPSEDAFIVAAGAPNSSFAALNQWWTSASDRKSVV